ncbi:MAG: hypothetical protein KDA29_06895 [Phycisphaerales bacterium]|nr:hypothetical protein [Phycisphaerales bacterium]
MKNSVIALSALISTCGLAIAGGPAAVSGEIVVREGDMIDGSVVSSINSPFTNGNGDVGAVLALDDGRRAIWYGTGVIFTSDMGLPDSLTGGEGTMGIGNNGEFIYSPSFNGNDAVWGQSGLILAEPDQAPGLAAGFLSTFNSRPQMIDDGTGFWVGGVNDGMGGTSTASRHLFRSNPDGSLARVMGAGDVIGNSGGLTINASNGIDFDYHVSGNGSNMINALVANTSSTSDGIIAVNGSQVARESFATGQGDNWANFDHVSINNSGNYVFSGDTDGASSSDEFIAYNADIVLREGMSLGGYTLGGSVDALSINNLNQSVFIWDTVEATETLFFAGDANDFSSAIALLSVGDTFDENNDGIGDWIIDDFNASGSIGPGLDFAEDGLVYVEVDLVSFDGASTFEAIVSVAVPTPGTGALLAFAGIAVTRRRR